MNRGGFSWSRLLGVATMKSRVGRKIGIPLTESGRAQKVGRMVMRGGWVFWLIVIAVFARACGST